MRVRLVVDVDPRERYVIAKYFGDGGRRATRTQVRAFVKGAIKTAVRTQADAFVGRQRTIARKLRDAKHEEGDGKELTMPRENQLNMLDGAK